MATIPGHELQELADTSRLELAASANGHDAADRERTVARLRLVWDQRRFLFRIAGYGLLAATLLAFSIPKRYESTTLLMPPDDQSGSPVAMAAALAGKMSGSLAGMAGDVLGLKSSGALFVGILASRTVQDDLITKFDLRKVYGARTWQRARRKLSSNTSISEDRKSGVIAISVVDR